MKKTFLKGFSKGFILVMSLFYSAVYILFAITSVYLGNLLQGLVLFVIPFSFSFAIYIQTFKDIFKRAKK